MAPPRALVSRNPKSEYHTHPESSKIGGIIVAVILAVLVIAFICIQGGYVSIWVVQNHPDDEGSFGAMCEVVLPLT